MTIRIFIAALALGLGGGLAAHAGEVVKTRDGVWECRIKGKIIKAGDNGLWAADYPLTAGKGCAALTMKLPLRELKRDEKPTWVIFDRKGEQGRGGDPKSAGF